MTDLRSLARSRTLLCDGAMATLLFSEGLDMEEPPERWNLDRPEAVQQIYSRYYEAGSDIVQTNTFGGTGIRLARKNLQDKVYEINHAAAKSLKKVCPPGKFAAGNVGSTGTFLKQAKPYDIEEIQDAFEEQIQALVDGGVDLISIETMCSLKEALCALRAARAVSKLPVSVSMTFNPQPSGFFAAGGESVERCVATLVDAGADVIGSNCMRSEDMITVASVMRRATSYPILIKPNAGHPVVENSKLVYKQTPYEFARDGLRILEAGTNLIGGCCGTSPEFIRALCEKRSVPSSEEKDLYG